MNAYYTNNGKQVFDYLPLTFHIVNGTEDPSYTQFQQTFNTTGGMWIVKPGENSNRGCGIDVCETEVQI